VSDAEAYLKATTADEPSIAAAEVMDRLKERHKAADGSAGELAELKAAAEAVGELAAEADRPPAVIETARNEAASVAEETRRSKDTIVDRLEAGTDHVLQASAEEDLRLENMCALDTYLEEYLGEVVIQRSTDAVSDSRFRWQFENGHVYEHDDSIHMDRFNFWTELVRDAREPLTHELASEQIGDPDEEEDRYRKLSLGPESRPWHPSMWVECIHSLLDERAREVEVVGPRTSVWEDIQNWIRRTRFVEDLADAVTNSQARAIVAGEDDIEEVWVPASVVSEHCEEWGITATALQAELAERGVGSDDVPGDGLSEAFTIDGAAMRYWRLNAGHDEVPEPDETVAELADGVDRDIAGHGFEYGGDGE
jgi:hypothetical protein